MFWKRKHKVAPADLADALLNEFVRSVTFDAAKHLGLDAPAVARFEEKASLCKIASVLMALANEEQNNPGFLAVRTELERRIFSATPEQDTGLLAEIKDAMRDLGALIMPKDPRKE